MTLWSIHTNGMDEYRAAVSLTEARRQSHALNALIIERGKDDDTEPGLLWCRPEPWPWDAASHAADLLKTSD